MHNASKSIRLAAIAGVFVTALTLYLMPGRAYRPMPLAATQAAAVPVPAARLAPSFSVVPAQAGASAS